MSNIGGNLILSSEEEEPIPSLRQRARVSLVFWSATLGILVLLVAAAAIATAAFNYNGRAASPHLQSGKGPVINMASQAIPSCALIDTDYFGADLDDVDRIATDARACQSSCAATTGCFYFTFKAASQKCFFKTSAVGSTAGSGLVSGPRSCDAQTDPATPETSSASSAWQKAAKWKDLSDAMQDQASSYSQATAPKPRKGSFIVIGDWGYDHNTHGNVAPACQQLIAARMLEKFQELGDVKFIINVGDSFYPCGVTSSTDWQWDAKWRKVYAPELRSVPWYSTYGNHDYQHDPCACGDTIGECAQYNSNIYNLDHFYMPGFNYKVEHPELDLEVVAMDMNDYMWGWYKKTPPLAQCAWDCKISKCQAKCEASLKNRSKDGENLFYARKRDSKAKNLVVFSHYPTDYFDGNENFLNGLRDNSKHHIEYFGGHRHNVDQTSTTSVKPNNNWLVGGGGGWGCDVWKGVPNQQGFVVGEIDGDGKLSTYGVFVDSSQCCTTPPPSPPPDPTPPPTTSTTEPGAPTGAPWPPTCTMYR